MASAGLPWRLTFQPLEVITHLALKREPTSEPTWVLPPWDRHIAEGRDREEQAGTRHVTGP